MSASKMTTQARMEVDTYSRDWPVKTDDHSRAVEYIALIQETNYPHGIKTNEGAIAFYGLITSSKHHFRVAATQLVYLRDVGVTWGTAAENSGQFGKEDEHKMALLYERTRNWRPRPAGTIERSKELKAVNELVGAAVLNTARDTTIGNQS